MLDTTCVSNALPIKFSGKKLTDNRRHRKTNSTLNKANDKENGRNNIDLITSANWHIFRLISVYLAFYLVLSPAFYSVWAERVCDISFSELLSNCAFGILPGIQKLTDNLKFHAFHWTLYLTRSDIWTEIQNVFSAVVCDSQSAIAFGPTWGCRCQASRAFCIRKLCCAARQRAKKTTRDQQTKLACSPENYWQIQRGRAGKQNIKARRTNLLSCEVMMGVRVYENERTYAR